MYVTRRRFEALAKIMDFLRAVSIILVVMNVYWFCYEAIRMWA